MLQYREAQRKKESAEETRKRLDTQLRNMTILRSTISDEAKEEERVINAEVKLLRRKETKKRTQQNARSTLCQHIEKTSFVGTDEQIEFTNINDWISEDLLCNNELPSDSKTLQKFEKDPRAAVLLYHFQSGLLKEFEAPKSDLKMFSDGPTPDGEEKKLFSKTDKEMTHIENAVKAFNHQIGQEANYIGCAGCGEIFRDEECDEILLGHKHIEHLVLDKQSQTDWITLSPIGRTAHHVTKFEDKLYAIAPLLIHKEKKVGTFAKNAKKLSVLQIIRGF